MALREALKDFLEEGLQSLENLQERFPVDSYPVISCPSREFEEDGTPIPTVITLGELFLLGGPVKVGAAGRGIIKSKELFKQSNIRAADTSIRNVMRMTGKTYNEVRVLVQNIMSKREINKIASLLDPKKLSTGTKVGVGTGVVGVGTGITISQLGKTTTKGALGVAGVDTIITWYAIDNMMTGQKFYLRDIVNAVKDGTMEIGEAQELFEASRTVRHTAETFVDTSTSLNPLLMPFKGVIQEGVEADIVSIELFERQLEDIAVGIYEGTFETKQQREERLFGGDEVTEDEALRDVRFDDGVPTGRAGPETKQQRDVRVRKEDREREIAAQQKETETQRAASKGRAATGKIVRGAQQAQKSEPPRKKKISGII